MMHLISGWAHRSPDTPIEGQEATVLQLPVQPTTTAEEEAQKRVAYAR